jgi:hypothetical protein
MNKKNRWISGFFIRSNYKEIMHPVPNRSGHRLRL